MRRGNFGIKDISGGKHAGFGRRGEINDCMHVDNQTLANLAKSSRLFQAHP